MTNYGAGEPAALITPYQDGPLIVRGNFQIQAPAGRPSRSAGGPWRCAGAGDRPLKPFCDGSPARTGSRAAGGREGAPPEPTTGQEASTMTDDR